MRQTSESASLCGGWHAPGEFWRTVRGLNGDSGRFTTCTTFPTIHLMAVSLSSMNRLLG